MRKLPVILVTIALALAAPAQQPKPTPAPPKAKVTKPEAEPAPRRSLASRIFGPRATPTPAPTPAPTPKPRPKPKPKPKPVATEEATPATPEVTPAPEKPAKPETPPAPEATPKPEGTPEATPPAPEVKPTPEAAPKPTGKKGDKTKKPVAAKPDHSGLDDAAKFKAVRTTALEDAAIKELKAKADSSVNEAEAHAASVAYNRALFRKIRTLEPSLDKYVDGVEAAMMKRLNAEKKGE